MRRLSVVVTNHNYVRFVEQAVDSALALQWPDVEVVVVDDGSTDESVAVLRGYGDRIILLTGPNAGQREAANRGFAASTGDVVIFLDADDVLPPGLPHRMDVALGPATSKVQFRMQRVDADGTPFGRPFPRWHRPPTPAQIRRWMRTTTSYPTPPGSGNAYARWFLERLFPVGADVGDAADSACLAAAPLHGDVVSVPEVLVAYRQHGNNDSNLLADPARFPREVERARARWRFAQRSIGVDERDIDERPLFRSRELLQFRAVSLRVAPDSQPLPRDRRLRVVVDAARSPLTPGVQRWPARLGVAAWVLAVALAPAPLVPALVRLRYR